METVYYKIKDNRTENTAALEKAGEIIRSGGLVAFPTETVYGLGASALSDTAAKKIYEAKGRPSDNPLIVHISDTAEAEKIAYTSEMYQKLAERFMPGPLTVILPKRDIIPDSVTGGGDTVGIRCPINETARELIRLAGVPIAAPSANSSGKPSPTSALHVKADLDGKIDMIIDGGECDIGVESTVISLCGDALTILRPGAVTEDMLREVCAYVTIDKAVVDPSLAGANPKSPGMKYKHYSPMANVILLDGNIEAFIDYVNRTAGNRDGVFAAENEKDKFGCTVLTVGDGSDEDIIHQLYAQLRHADELSLDNVYIKAPATSGEALALYNRLIRAAGGKVIKL